MSGVYAVWLRNDLRFHDNQAIYQALRTARETDGSVVLFFHLHPAFTRSIDLHHNYFFQSVKHFQERCDKLGLHIPIFFGDHHEAFTKLTEAYDTLKAVFYQKDYTRFGKERDKEITSFLHNKGIVTYGLKGSHIVQPDELTKSDGTPYHVFTAYFRKWQQQQKPNTVAINLEELKSRYVSHNPQQIQDDTPYFKHHILTYCPHRWTEIGEETARAKLEQFIEEQLATYADSRDQPARSGTSKLSPFIKTGALSPATIFHSVMAHLDAAGKGAETYIKELAWRDFYAMIYHVYPETDKQEYQQKYRQLPWRKEEGDLWQRWITGTTGFPIVDAGMRQLNATGWMHNRLRMITASFLTKDYFIDWRLGDAYFAKKLIDYDIASNVGGWQWVASVGTDAVPYFRVFNPTRQSERFDPQGTFIKQYVPELAQVPVKYSHHPATMSHATQVESACLIGHDYPEPSVDHALQRKKIIAIFKEESL
ncbi:DNA photolyase family protein [Salipaludibacillus sp. LMS25]|jgi:deoxyribodipyrimidine photo-lyase|uniref:cryptochrome/photolyase family protein n=1 Tax=Salipaludibacillus sp. LMS25 TaxID=2924031 RepID=UPI0020D11E0C|nr:deoxyribodipyrimidine photo-lyase [Salipaludibacillus sp. LMS25]UTR13949.1 DNA photolyase family protein [Salipaludibacillus sp. LMS25]